MRFARYAAVAAFAALALFDQGLAAQTRRPLLGTVVDGRGAPLAGATVQVVFVQIGGEHLPATDQATVTTDERGRFRADVLPCARCRAWAIGPPTDDGSHLVSEVAWCSAGHLLELCARDRQAPMTLTVDGAAAWSDVGPLRVRVLAGGAELPGHEFELDANGQIRMPPLPNGYVGVEILAANGTPLHADTAAPSAAPRVTLPPPRTVPMRARDADGKPVAGATVRQRIESYWIGRDGLVPNPPPRTLWRELGRTDDDGQLAATIANDEDPFTKKGWQRLLFLASKAGCATTYSGFTDQPFGDGKSLKAEGTAELPFTLAPAMPVRGRLLRDATTGIGEQVVTLQSMLKIAYHGSYMQERMVAHAMTTGDGSFVFEDLPAASEQFTVVVARGPAAELLVPEAERRMSPPQPIALHPMGNRPNHLQLSLSDQHRVQLRLLDQANGPAGGAEIMWISKRDGLRDPDGFTPIAATDSAGRVAMRVQAGPWVVFARTSSAMALETVAVNSDTELQVQLHPMPAMRGRVVDGAGQPVPGAILQLRRSRWSGGPGRDDDLVHIASNLNWQWIGNTRSTADGSFECCFIEVPNASYEGVFTANGKQSAPITIASGEQPTTVVIE